MKVMDELAESHRRTPSFHHVGAQSPRVGGCVGAFFNMFDWNPSKRFASTKRITADRPNSEVFYAARETRSFAERASNTATSTLPQPLLINEGKNGFEVLSKSLKSTPTLSSTQSPASVKSDGTSKRLPGVVARLMGLESLPDGAYSSSKCEPQYLHSSLACEQLDSQPVLLQELLRQELLHSRKSSKVKLPGFTKRAAQESGSARGLVSQTRRKSTGHFGGNAHPYGDSRGSRPARSSEKSRASVSQDNTNKVLVKQPFLARLQAGTPPTLLPSKPQSSSSPLLSPSILGGKNTVRLLEAAVKSLEPSPRSRYCLSRDSQTENGGSFRSERRVTTNSSHGRVGSLSRSSSRSSRSQQPSSKTEKASEHSGHLEMVSPGSRNSRTRHELSKQDQASRKRFETALVTSVAKSPSLSQSRAPNSRKVEGPPRAVLGSHEASVRGFKLDLGDLECALEQAVENREVESQSVGFKAGKLPPAPPPSEDMDVNVESPKPCDSDQNSDASHGLSAVSKAPEKPMAIGGFRSIRFRNRSGEQQKDVGAGQGSRVFPSDKHPVVKPVSPPLTKDVKAAGAGFSYSMLFSGRKQGEKKEGTDKGEALVMKRTDSTLVRSMLRRPSSTPGPTPVATTKSASQCNVKKATKSSKKVDVEVDEEVRVEAAKGEDSFSEEAWPLTQKQFDTSLKDGSCGQARCRSIDDVFPELPMEENDVGGASPDLSKTVKAVEEQFLGFGSQEESALANCRSIERMFGRDFSESYVSTLSTSPDFSSFDNATLRTSPISPEVFITECGSVPGTFPNSPLVKYEKIFFSSRNHLNLQHMFEVVSGDLSNDMTGCQRSICLSEPQERVLPPSHDEGAAADLDTCSNSAVCDTGGTPERLEIQKMSVDPGWSEDVMMTPPGLKKFDEKLVQASLYKDASCVEESGQPSPVSVLENPFLDEGPTTPAASLASSQETDGDVNESGATEPSPQTQKLRGNNLAIKDAEVTQLDIVETEQIKQAILDISRIRNIDVTRIGLEPLTTAPVESPQQEQNYVREVLDAANLLRGGGSSWYAADLPIHCSLFDRLESGSVKLDERTLMESKRFGSLPDARRQGSSVRSERKLLFDSINEIMVLKPWMKTSSFHVDLPMFPDLYSNSKFRSPISAEPLVKEVYGMVTHWRDIAGNVLDDLIDYDMSVPEGRWVDFSREVADIGLGIERMLVKEMIEEFAGDLASTYRTRA